ncbi:MAG TPA: hypothetical protein VH107_00135, partial [Lacipirellulaceae bacterium]|nr:hypothetical protein [Lacipirellulaceae bacterium]
VAGQETDASKTQIVLPLPDAGIAGVREAATGMFAPLDPIGQRALRLGWNDVRLNWRADHIELILNGWPAFATSIAIGERSAQIAFAIAPGDSPIRWRYLRLRLKDALPFKGFHE